MTLRVAVVEDDPMMRLALTSAVKLAGLELAFDAGSSAQAVASAKTQKIDAAVLDLHLGEGPTGVDVANECADSIRAWESCFSLVSKIRDCFTHRSRIFQLGASTSLKVH